MTVDRISQTYLESNPGELSHARESFERRGAPGCIMLLFGDHVWWALETAVGAKDGAGGRV